MLITDYSSVYFDIAYMRKPIIFYQFDEETQIIQKPIEAYVNYTYEIEKGEYYND